MKSKAGGSHFDYNGTGGLPIHESGLRVHHARRSLPNLMSASTPSKSILLIDDDDLIAADGKIAALLAKPQSILFLSQFLVGMPRNSIETSIKGQTL
jgi:hypothetical protein